MSTHRGALQRNRRLENYTRWREHVLDQAHGSLTQREYCRIHKLGYASFVRWRGVIRRESQPSDVPSGFMPVVVDASPTVVDVTESGLSVLLPSGVRISGITAANLSQVSALVAVL